MSTATSVRSPAQAIAPGVAVPLGAFLAGLGPVALLGFDGGGYAVATVAGLGIVLWWLLAVGLLSGALPRPRPTTAGWTMLAGAAALAVWGAITLGWSGGSERGLTEVVRLLVLAGSLLLGMVAVGAGQARLLIGGVLTGLVAICAAGVLSRLQPDLFPGSSDIAVWLGERRRLSWPLNYWNGMGAAAALTVPLCLTVAARARTAVTSALAAAAIPIVVVGLVLTLSRGGIAAAALGLIAAIAIVAPRLVLLRTAIAPAIGSAAALVAVLGSDPIRQAVGGQAQTDAGTKLLPLLVLIVVGVALVQAGWQTADRARWTPRLPRPSPRAQVAGWLMAAVAALAIALAAGLPGRASDAWNDFRDPAVKTQTVAGEASLGRLASAASSGRYEEWSGAIRAIRAHPLGGIGLGSWESWWSPRRDRSPAVRNAHSEPLEIAAETGLPGLLLLVTIVLAPLAAAIALLRRSRGRPAPYALVAAPTLVAFVVAISVDWAWQLSALPVAAALLAAALVGRGRDVPVVSQAATTPLDPATAPERRRRLAFAGPLALGAAAVGSIVVLAVALIAPDGVERSRAAVGAGALDRAASIARDTRNAAPFSLDAALQRALVAERSGDLSAAARAAADATRIEPRNWRPWIVLARIEVARGRPRAAVAAYRRARALNPRSPLLRP
ncbi:O-antigen ligase family protein [Patulibacter medicamentivorans]|uniref:O-antigen ligase family protein n=1 Tax=Patulibacter medicamentivorans TaxID=1097667 RepID=UPI00058B4222|nr:O-antigen ligase family protein [Patulibacter medicamentivorans]